MKKSLSILIVLILILATYTAIANQQEKNNIIVDSLVRINIEGNNLKLLNTYEIVSGKPGMYLEYIIPSNEIYFLDENNIDYTVIDENINDYIPSNLRNYHTLEEVEQILQTTAQNYPEITSLYSIGKTFEDRDIWCLEITDNPGVDEDETGVFFMGLHHAREWPTLEICLYIIENLTSNYNVDSAITNLINNRRIWIIPCVNPDGYYYCFDLNNDWRKNRHYFPEYDSYGVDLNRNYQGSSNGDPDGMWGSLGMYHNPGLSLYCGPTPFSEIESQAIKNMFIENDISASISYHTHGELLMWPWGYSGNVQTPDNDYMAEVGTEMAALITQQDGSGTYEPTQSAGLYNFDAAFYLLNEAENIRNIIPRVIPPIINDVSVDDNNYVLSWEQQNPDASPDYYQLQELSNLYLYTDTAASAELLWDLNDFTVTDETSYSADYCYKSHTDDDKVSSMTTKYPLYVEEDMSLSFWCKYNIEEDYDEAMIEVSNDGRLYDVLDTFTGAQNNWVQKQYSLEEYTSESIYIRFRYSTDEGTSYTGFFIDDISPIPEYLNVDTIQEQLTETTYDFSNKPNGIYYYQVKGHNTLGWGDFSTIKKVKVDTNQNQPPSAPTITGTSNGEYDTSYSYTFAAQDPESDEIYYYISWGDEINEGWLGPYPSDTTLTINHTWTEEGEYIIKARAKDTNDNMGEWSTLQVSMPYKHSQTFILRWIYKIITFLQMIGVN
jgi:hypothetical protein